MSSLDANSFNAKPPVVNVSSKPLGVIATIDKGLPPANQTPPKLQLKSLHKHPPHSVNADIRPDIQRKPHDLVSRIPVFSRECSAPQVITHSPGVSQFQQHRPKVLLPAAPVISSISDNHLMGNQDSRALIPNSLHSSHIGVTPTTSGDVSRMGLPTSSFSGAIPQSGASIASHASLQQPMASIIKATEGQRLVSSQLVGPVNLTTNSTGPRVVSTPNTKTITGGQRGGTFMPGVPIPMSVGATQHTAVIQSPTLAGMRTSSNVRSAIPPVLRNNTAPGQISHRPMSPAAIAPAVTAQGQNPTTVQITIQSKPTVASTMTSDRTSINAQPRPHALAIPPLPTSMQQQQQPVLQKLVISQGSTCLSQNVYKTAVTLAPADSTRIITTNSSSQPGNRRPIVRPVPAVSVQQHDYTKSTDAFSSSRKASITAAMAPDMHLSVRPTGSGIPIHTMPDASLTTHCLSSTPPISHYSSAFYSAAPVLSQTNAFKANYPMAHSLASVTQASVAGRQSAFLSAKPTNDNAMESGNLSGGSLSSSPRPSILRKRHAEVSNTPVVRRVMQTADVSRLGDVTTGGTSTSTSPMRVGAISSMCDYSCDEKTEVRARNDKDNASQSSTDTALSSESPIYVKPEPTDLLGSENGTSDIHQNEVSPRKKPRKQLLNTASELKDRHNSSTEEETETKTVNVDLRVKHELEHIKASPIKDEFIDKDGIRWVKMRPRNSDSLIVYYNCTWRPRNNHFQRHSDVKVKEKSDSVVSELCNQKGVAQRASGWKFYHLSAQLEDMIQTQVELHERMNQLQNVLSSRIRQSNPEANKIHELAQANKQRCSLTKDQMQEAKSSMFSILDKHKTKILDIIQRHHSKRPVKKKER